MTATAPIAGRQIVRAAALVMAFFLLSRVAGLAREMIIGARFGTSADLDAYLAAFRVPDLLFQLVAGGALGSAFIPVFTGCLARHDLDGAWRMFSAVTNLILFSLTTLAVIAAVAAPWLVRTLLAPGFTSAQQALTVTLMRWMLVSTVIFGVSGILMGVLNSLQHFLLPALAPVLYNLSIIAAAWFLAPDLGVYGLVIGVVVGAALHMDVQLLGLWWHNARYRAALGLRDPAVREVGRLMAPRVLGLAAVQVNFWVNTLLASSLPAGSLSALNYAWMLMLLPQGIVAQGVATAAFPTFAALEAQGRRAELRRALSDTLRGVLFLAIPAAAGLFAWRVPLIRLLLERGAFTAHSTGLTSTALGFYAFGLVGHSAVEILARAFYALHDTRTPVTVGIAAMLGNVLLSLWLRRPLGHAGLALANTLAVTAEMILLFGLLSRRLDGLEWPALWSTIARSAMAAGAMAVPLAWGAQRWGDAPVFPIAPIGLAAGLAIYLAVAALLRMPELGALRRAGWARK
ncbi:MAG: murein biosynthesis integral membrane protein MurJ [Anaerolineae bacterium]